MNENNIIVKNIVNKLFNNPQSVLFGKNLQDVRNLSRVFFTRKLFKSKFHRDLYLSSLLKKYDIKNGIELYNFITIEQQQAELKIPTFARQINTRTFNRKSTLFAFTGPLELLHADIADI